MWTTVVFASALIAFSNAQSCGDNAIYTSSCSYCEETCYPHSIKCGTDMNPECSSGKERCICPAGHGVARNACGGCSDRSMCPSNDTCNFKSCPEGQVCEARQICIRASPLNYGECVPDPSIPTTPTSSQATTTDPCEGFFCPCGTICTKLSGTPEPTCFNYGACGRGLSNCTAGQLCEDEGMSSGTPPDCEYQWNCTDLPPQTTEAPLSTTTRDCPPGQRFYKTFVNRDGQCLPEDTTENPCKYLRCRPGYSCVQQPVPGCSCCGQNARCLATDATGFPSTTPMPATTSPHCLVSCPANMVRAKCNLCSKQCGEPFTPFWECNQTCQEEPYCQCPQKGYSLYNGECIPDFFCPSVTTPNFENVTESPDMTSVRSTTRVPSSTLTTTSLKTTSQKPTPASEEARGRFERAFEIIDCSKGAEFTVLIQALLQMSNSLSGSDQSEFLAVVHEVRDHIICNSSLTAAEMIVRASYRIKFFCSLRVSVKKIIQYTMIGSWGTLNDLFNIAITIKGQSAQSVIVMTGGKSDFTDALELILVTLSGEERTDLALLISECKEIFSKSSFTFSQKMVEIQFKFRAFFKKHVSLKAKFRSIEIGVWGTFEMFMDVSLAWYRFFQFRSLFSIRSGQSLCIMAHDMTADVYIESYGLSRAEQTSTLDFIGTIQAPSQDVSLSLLARAKAIIHIFGQFMLTSKFLFARIREFEIDVDVEFGTFGDFLDCYDIIVILNPEGTDVPSPPPSTKVPSTTPTTTIPQTTTPVTGNCATYGPLFHLKNDHSIVVDSLYAACATYNGTQCTNFKPYILKIDNGVIRNSTMTTDSERLSYFTYIIEQYCGTNQLRLYFVMGSRMSNGWGNVRQLVDCSRKSG